MSPYLRIKAQATKWTWRSESHVRRVGIHDVPHVRLHRHPRIHKPWVLKIEDTVITPVARIQFATKVHVVRGQRSGGGDFEVRSPVRLDTGVLL